MIGEGCMAREIIRIAAFVALAVVAYINAKAKNKYNRNGLIAVVAMTSVVEVANEGLAGFQANSAWSSNLASEVVENTREEQRECERESEYIHLSEYIEGWYSGEMENGLPNGIGHLEYDLEEDGYVGCIWLDGIRYKTLSYEGAFVDGYRNGQGTLVYEGGIKDEGIFYGAWQQGKTIFTGKRYYPGGNVAYIEMIADNQEHANAE